MNQKPVDDKDELKLCNCDGFWHVSIPDGDSFVTKYVDMTEADAHYQKKWLELIGKDDTDTRGDAQNPANPKYWTRRTKYRNELRAELREALTNIKSEGEK